MFDAARGKIRRLVVLKGNGRGNESERDRRSNGRYDNDVSTAAQASIAGTGVVGILSSVCREKASGARNQVASKDFRRRQKQDQKRGHAPDCLPVRHFLCSYGATTGRGSGTARDRFVIDD